MSSIVRQTLTSETSPLGMRPPTCTNAWTPLQAAVYFDDLYVDASLQLDTLGRVGAGHAWVTNEFEHDGLHGDRVFKHLLDEARDRGDLAGLL